MTSSPRSARPSTLVMQKTREKGGTGFDYDPSNYRDSKNDGNYRRLSDQLAAAKAENEKLEAERKEIERKEQIQKMFLEQESKKFWDTPDETVVATSD